MPWSKSPSTCKLSKSADSNIEISNRFESLACEDDVEEFVDQETLKKHQQKKIQTNIRTLARNKRVALKAIWHSFEYE